jgi:hypothetical protein
MLRLTLYQFRSMCLCVCTRRIHALPFAMSFMKGVLLKTLLCALIITIHAPLLHFSVSSINYYPPLPPLMTNCSSLWLPVQRVVRCFVLCTAIAKSWSCSCSNLLHELFTSPLQFVVLHVLWPAQFLISQFQVHLIVIPGNQIP